MVGLQAIFAVTITTLTSAAVVEPPTLPTHSVSGKTQNVWQKICWKTSTCKSWSLDLSIVWACLQFVATSFPSLFLVDGLLEWISNDFDDPGSMPKSWLEEFLKKIL